MSQPQQNSSFDSKDFRAVLSAFATGITVVTALDAAGQPVGVTINSFTSVSLNPPLVLFCLGDKTRSLDSFVKATHFAINILSDQQQDVSALFAGKNAKDWSKVDWQAGQGGVPLLKGSLAQLECKAFAQHPGGDHVIIIGEVIGVTPPNEKLKPLLYYRSAYRHLG